MQDSIERSITVKAPKETVYAALTDPAKIIAWFPDSVAGPLEVGQHSTFDFGSDGTARVLVTAAEPFSRFAFRWYTMKGEPADVLAVPNTLVEFVIEEMADSTKVTVKESGFASLPAEVAEKSLQDNTGGWEYMMNRLEEIMNQA